MTPTEPSPETPPDAADRAQALALVVGIDDYPYLSAPPLLGCRHDAEQISARLAALGFEVERLIDAAATRDAVCDALDALARRVRPGDRVVVHWSGHGSRVRWPDGRRIETLVPHDSGRGEHENRDIADLEVRAWLRRIADTTPYVTLVLDSCHSGGAARDAELGARARCVDEDTRPATLTRWSTHFASRGESATAAPRAWERYTWLAACRADEYPKQRPHPRTGQPHGAFTLALTEAIDTLDGPVSHRDVFEEVTRWFERQRVEGQHPQLEGSLDRELFGSRELAPMRFAPVVARQGDQVDLAAGEAHAVTPGSTWCVVAPRTRALTDAARLGTLRVVEVAATRSRAEVVDELAPGAVAVGARAVEIERPTGDGKMPVAVLAEPESTADHVDLSTLRRRLGASALLTLVDGSDEVAGQTEIVVRSQEPSSGVPRWTAVGPSGRQVMRPMRAGPTASLDRLVENLESLARHRALRRLQPPGADRGGLPGVVRAELLSRRSGAFVAPSVDLDGVPVYVEGESLGVRIRHDHDACLFLAVLDLGLCGAVELLYPIRGAWEPVEPGREILVGADDDLVLGLPDGFPFPGDAFDFGEETILVLATTRAADFDLLRQAGVRTSGPNAGRHESDGVDDGPLGRVLRRALRGGDRDVRQASRRQVPDRWTVERRTLRLRASALVR